MKPYFGLGANSALEDVKILKECLDDVQDDIPKAVQEYSRRRARDAQTLVRISRELDRPGVLGTFTFLVPIILDGIFLKLFPKLFQPNVITMLQREDLTFQQVARRKRLDRIGQLSLLFGGMYGTILGMKWIVQKLMKITGTQNPLLIYGGFIGTWFSYQISTKIIKAIKR